jgi:hypothetical protein
MAGTVQGKAKGGIARAKALSAQERKEIARKGAAARWDDTVPIATHGAQDHPLKIGDIEIPCYVLADGRRVLIQNGMLTGLDMKQGTAGRGEGDRLAKFLGGKAITPYVNKDLYNVIMSPIKFKTPTGSTAYGYEATILADICDAVLEARKSGRLNYQSEHIAARCEILVRGFARVGIIALVDEVTGYEKDRVKDALAQILEAFITKELQPWIKTFPSDFYQEMFRLRQLPYPTTTVKRPQYFGVLTNNIVYDRLAPGVRDELQRGVPRNEAGRPTAKYFQKLTQNTGYPKLREHLGSVVTLMKLSDSWKDFMHKVDKLHPKFGSTLSMDFEYKKDEDDGKGI